MTAPIGRYIWKTGIGFKHVGGYVLADQEPTGANLVYYRNTGAAARTSNGDGTYNCTDLQTALNAVASGKTLVLEPNTTYTADFVGSTTNCCFQVNRSMIGWVGHRADTILKANSATFPTAPTTGTNPAYVVRVANQSGMLYQDFTVDANSPGSTFGCGGMRLAGAGVSTVTRVTVKNWRGTSNVPPGETFGFGMNSATDGTTFTDCIADGGGIGAAGFGFNTCCNWSQNGGSGTVYLVRCIAKNTGSSHGFAMYQMVGVSFVDCEATNCGTAGGSSSQYGAGFNCEELSTVGQVTHLRSNSHDNSRWGYRWEQGDNGGAAVSSSSLFLITDSSIVNCPIGFQTENLQNVYPTFTNTTNSGTTPLLHVA